MQKKEKVQRGQAKKSANYIPKRVTISQNTEDEIRRKLKLDDGDEFYEPPYTPRKNRIQENDRRNLKRWCKYKDTRHRDYYATACPHRLLILKNANGKEERFQFRTYYKYRQFLLDYKFMGWVEYNGK